MELWKTAGFTCSPEAGPQPSRRSTIRRLHSPISAPGWVGTAPIRSCRTRSSPPFSASTVRRSLCSRKRTDTRPEASSQGFDGRNGGTLWSIRVASGSSLVRLNVNPRTARAARRWSSPFAARRRKVWKEAASPADHVRASCRVHLTPFSEGPFRSNRNRTGPFIVLNAYDDRQMKHPG